MQTIEAKVSARILSKADRLFTNRLSQIFVELLQNARRAGASLVTVTTSPSPTDSTSLITFTDNGSGIEDFNKLLHLGESGWDQAVERAEDPAGMGLFALLHTGVVVRSRGKTATITTDAFLGKEAVQVHDQDSVDPKTGTTVVFAREEAQAAILDVLLRVARFGPIDVKVNGELLKREDFLANAVYIKEVDGVRIGVFVGHSEPLESVNFHGNLIRVNLSETALGKIVVSPTHNDLLSVGVRLDITSTASLHLKLPDRTDLVYDEAYHTMRKQVRRTILEYLASEGVQHIASYAVYKEALQLDIPIQPAVPYLQPFFVSARDSNSGQEPFNGDRGDYLATIHDPAKCALVCLDDYHADSTPFTFDLGSRDRQLPTGLVPVRENSGFKGYSWYDNLACCRNFKLTIDGKPAEDAAHPLAVTIVNGIQLSFDLERAGAIEQVAWNLPFAGWGEEDENEASLFITRDSEWAQTSSPYQPFSLIDVAQHLAFDPSDDFEADSYETQEQYFKQRYEEAIIEAIGGALAAARLALSRALGWDLTRALDAAHLSEVRFVRTEDGKWKVDLPTAP